MVVSDIMLSEVFRNTMGVPHGNVILLLMRQDSYRRILNEVCFQKTEYMISLNVIMTNLSDCELRILLLVKTI